MGIVLDNPSAWRMVPYSASLVLCLLCAVVGLASGASNDERLCPNGWDHYCDDASKCVMSMTEFENDKECLRKGGVPGAIACFQKDTAVYTETHERMCIKDLNTGEFGFAANLQAAMN